MRVTTCGSSAPAALLALWVALVAGDALAAEPERIGVHRDWGAYQIGSRRSRECFAHSVPFESRGKYKRRGDVLVQVTHRLRDGVRDEVSFTAGYSYKSGSLVKVDIDGRPFELFVHDDRAYAHGVEGDRALTSAMRRGHTMVVRGISSRGTHTTDKYSLTGFSSAYEAIGRACPGG